MKNVNVFCEFWRIIDELKYLRYDVRAYKMYSTNKRLITCKHLINSSVVEVSAMYVDENEHLQGFYYATRVNAGVWYDAKDRQALYEWIKAMSEF